MIFLIGEFAAFHELSFSTPPSLEKQAGGEKCPRYPPGHGQGNTASHWSLGGIVSSSTAHSGNPQKNLKIQQFLGAGGPVRDLYTSLGEITRKCIPRPKNSFGFPSNGKKSLVGSFTEFDNIEKVASGGMNAISFSFFACFALDLPYISPALKPQFPPLKFLSSICWD